MVMVEVFRLNLRKKSDYKMRQFSKIMICIGALIMIMLGMIVYDTWKDKIYFSLAVLFVTALSFIVEYSCSKSHGKINEKENK